jgi:predicted AlkP superfamily pyrophosphatase or phosphodiesterase
LKIRFLGTGAAAANYIAMQKPAFASIYLETPDVVGHLHGWMSVPYLQAVSKADSAIGLVLEPLRASGRLTDTVRLVLSDHGGQDFDHDAGLTEDLTIP